MHRLHRTALATLPLLALAARPAPPALGPGAIESMHRQLFAALDTGDAERAVSFLDLRSGEPGGDAEGHGPQAYAPWVALPGPAGAVVSARGPDDAHVALAAFAKSASKEGPGWSTRILRSQADCAGEHLSFAVLEVERTRTGVGKNAPQRFLWTSLVRYHDGGWKIFHAHVSPVADATR